MTTTADALDVFGQPLALHRPAVQTLEARVQAALAEPSAAAGTVYTGAPRTYNAGNLRVIEIAGMLSKAAHVLGGTNPLLAAQAMRDAAADASVGGIMLRIDSPGGATGGITDLAGEITAAAQTKPVHAFGQELLASGAYWVASQASRVSANEGAYVGSIGVYFAVLDASESGRQRGAVWHVISSAPLKAAGHPGAPLTAEQRAYFQGLVDDTHALFAGAVRRGRRLSVAQAKVAADGRVHLAGAAQQLGLLDAVETFSVAMEQLRAAVGRRAGGSDGPASAGTLPGPLQLSAGQLDAVRAKMRTTDLYGALAAVDPSFARLRDRDQAATAQLHQRVAQIREAKRCTRAEAFAAACRAMPVEAAAMRRLTNPRTDPTLLLA